ncbi:MAG: hypothetical protein K9M45_13215, partial [Kiritimatiellales bacterium]|nr:hypothetical protein [Kiritimatiellales bacterium]
MKKPLTSTIDREAVVSRHAVDWPELSGQVPLGNGNFAFNADGTGLQTFGGNTMSHWCWHHFPLPQGTDPQDIVPWAAREKGRLKGAGTYPVFEDWHEQHRFQRANGYGVTTPPPRLESWYRHNPHPLNLGRLGFIDAKGKRLYIRDCSPGMRRVDLWTGIQKSRFAYRETSVETETCVGYKNDAVAVRVTSPLLSSGEVRLRLDFPAPANPASSDPLCKLRWDPNGSGNPVPWVGDFNNPSGHQTECIAHEPNRVAFRRTVDATCYYVTLAGPGIGHAMKQERATGPMAPHCIDFGPFETPNIEFTCTYSREPLPAATILSFAQTQKDCLENWRDFWNSGGGVDLSGSKDPRWFELERRIVLSQYQTAVNSAGDQFPAEVGLTGIDGWSAKFHLEMAWWHIAHFALWNRWPMAGKALTYYRRNANLAGAIARNFDYNGLMWPKFTGPEAIHDGYPEAMALMWRQPHPIFFAELEYRSAPTEATLTKW